MAVAVASTASVSNIAGDNVSITAPTGITAGDLLVASISAKLSDDPTSYTDGVTGPSGWTLSFVATNETGADDNGTGFWYKVADSGDEAAGSFTWTIGSAQALGGAVLRITGWSGSANPFYATDEWSFESVSSGTKTRSVTLSKVTSSIVLLGRSELNGQNSSSNYFITHGTTNPTWTEIIDDANASGDEESFAVAYATTTNTSDITAYGFDTSSGGFFAVAFAVIASPQDTPGTHALLDTSPTFFAEAAVEVGTAGTSALHETSPTFFAANGDATTGTDWTNEDDADTTWTNESL